MAKKKGSKRVTMTRSNGTCYVTVPKSCKRTYIHRRGMSKGRQKKSFKAMVKCASRKMRQGYSRKRAWSLCKSTARHIKRHVRAAKRKITARRVRYSGGGIRYMGNQGHYRYVNPSVRYLGNQGHYRIW